jgi:GNAT superfamily N-acetyltransferase
MTAAFIPSAAPFFVNPRSYSPFWKVRLRTALDIPAIRQLMVRVFPPPHGPAMLWSEVTLLGHLEVFPEGQLVAQLEDGRIIGTATTLRVSRAKAFNPHRWSEISGQGTLSTHDPAGSILYGVNIAVDPAFQGRGVGYSLYMARLDRARDLGCSALVTGARIPGFRRHSGRLTPEAYVAEVVRGSLRDPTLSKHLRMGFGVQGVLRDYAYDYETLGHAAFIVLEP